MTKLYILAGPDKGQSFDLSRDSIFVGRSAHSDVQMKDGAVSRRHLKIFRRANRYLIKDLESQNGTFIGGKRISTAVEVEVAEGVPIVIGMSVICLGKGCLELIRPFLDGIHLSEQIKEGSGIFKQHGDMTTQKILELVYKVSEILTHRLELDEILEKVLEYIFDFLQKIDRGAIILVDDETGDIRKVSSRLREPTEATTRPYSQDVVHRVIVEGRGLVVSDIHSAGEEEDLADTLGLSKIQSVMCVPLMIGSQVKGVLYLDSLKDPYGFRREDLPLFMDLTQRTALAIENARFALESTTIADNSSSDT